MKRNEPDAERMLLHAGRQRAERGGHGWLAAKATRQADIQVPEQGFDTGGSLKAIMDGHGEPLDADPIGTLPVPKIRDTIWGARKYRYRSNL